jgi:hypothetical protein
MAYVTIRPESYKKSSTLLHAGKIGVGGVSPFRRFQKF